MPVSLLNDHRQYDLAAARASGRTPGSSASGLGLATMPTFP